MRDAIDKTSTQQGTLINRDFLMAVQGFDNFSISIGTDGTIHQINANNKGTKTIKFEQGSINATFQGQKTIKKKITITPGTKIEEVLL